MHFKLIVFVAIASPVNLPCFCAAFVHVAMCVFVDGTHNCLLYSPYLLVKLNSVVFFLHGNL